MFRIDRTPQFQQTLEFDLTEGDTTKTESFEVTFRVLDDDAYDAHDTGSRDGQVAYLKAVIARIDGMVDENDKPLESSPELIGRVVCWPDLRLALMRSYSHGVVEAAAGNSARPGVHGLTAH